MKVIIAGTRSIKDYKLVVETVGRSGFNIEEVVTGCATGVDRLGEQWARANNIKIKEMPAEWTLYGKEAGPIRNIKMAEYADASLLLYGMVNPQVHVI